MKKNQKIKEGLDSIGYDLDYYMGKEHNWKGLKEFAEHFKLNWLDLCTEKNFNTRYRYSSKIVRFYFTVQMLNIINVQLLNNMNDDPDQSKLLRKI